MNKLKIAFAKLNNYPLAVEMAILALFVAALTISEC